MSVSAAPQHQEQQQVVSAQENKNVFVIYCDGASRQNPGHAAIGVVCYERSFEKAKDKSVRGELLCEISEYIGKQTNNVAEYKALIAGLKKANEFGYSRVHAFMDSDLVVKQMTGRYQVRHPQLIPLSEEAKSLARLLVEFQIEHVYRSDNQEADAAANRALDNYLRTCFARD